AAGRALQGRLDAAVAVFVARLLADDAIPGILELPAAEVEDHVPALLADVATSLIVLGETGGEPELMRDGSDLQRMLAERHGAQRARLGWSERALRREFTLLREAAAEAALAGDDAAAGVLARFLDRACEISVRGMRLAGTAAERRGAEADALIAHTHRTIEHTRHTLRRVKKSVGVRPQLRGRDRE
ncbi:MAG TPA: hypothetical protein VHG91_11615, partial [Longimicrobium sp.]|nr:hypothetical protein [Longimicrobium sp.]